jgi:flagellar hook-basal body complex protein FliE
MDQISVGKRDVIPLSIPGEARAKTGSSGGFSDALSKAVTEVNALHQDADKAIQNIQTGHTENLHEAIIALEKADVSFRTLLTVRNKLIEAYQEIMRMQV